MKITLDFTLNIMYNVVYIHFDLVLLLLLGQRTLCLQLAQEIVYTKEKKKYCFIYSLDET